MTSGSGADCEAVVSADTNEDCLIDPDSTEKFKVEIHQLPRYAGYKDFKKMINSHGLQMHKMKIVKFKQRCRPEPVAYLNFINEEEQTRAVEKLNGLQWRHATLRAKVAKPVTDPYLQQKRKKEVDNAEELPAGKQRRLSEDVSEEVPESESRPVRIEVVSEANDIDPRLLLYCAGMPSPLASTSRRFCRLQSLVTPLWREPYEGQLEVKEKHMKEFLKKFNRTIERNNPTLRDWLETQKGSHDGLCCLLEPIKPSPVTERYRNKCEFSIGLNTRAEKAIGFRLGAYKSGELAISDPSACCHLPECMLTVLKSFETFISTSQLDVYDQVRHAGHWRMLTVRTSRRGDVMAIVQLHPQQLNKEELLAEKNRLRAMFQDGQVVKSVLWQQNCEKSTAAHREAECELLFGKEHIYEDVLDLKLRISPDAFFQVNTAAAEVLYTTIADWCSISPQTVLLDICCGTGAIGLALAKRAHRVIGVELCQQAVDDANYNATLNGITNTRFICGKAEELMPPIMASIEISSANQLVGIMDPPRAGLNASVIRAVRRCKHLKRLVYVSCNPSGALLNFAQLVSRESKKLAGPPFLPVRALPLDLFPHTNHCELVILFERV